MHAVDRGEVAAKETIMHRTVSNDELFLQILSNDQG